MKVVVTKLGSMTLAPVQDRPLPNKLVRIRVHCAGVNFADLLQVAGKYQEKNPLPFTPGGEVAGVVIQVGTDADSQLIPGSRVAAFSAGGGYSTIVDVHPSRIFSIPHSMSFELGAAIPVNFGTAMASLRAAQVPNLQRTPNSTAPWLLVTGASGGTGSAAILLAKARGLRVIAWARGVEKCRHCRNRLKADVVMDIGKGGLALDTATRLVKKTTQGHGVDVAIDNVGGSITRPLLRTLAWGGRLVIVGFASGAIPKIPANALLVKNAQALGIYFGGMFLSGRSAGTHDEGRECVSECLGLVSEGYIPEDSILRTTYPLEDVAAAHRALAAGSTGKLILSAGPAVAKL